jgi:hypothetical protein
MLCYILSWDCFVEFPNTEVATKIKMATEKATGIQRKEKRKAETWKMGTPECFDVEGATVDNS